MNVVPDHCIENLRQNIMCKGDVSLLTFEWMPKERAPKPNFDIEHDCVNWDTLDNWAESQRFDIFDEKSLVHPDLGLLLRKSPNLASAEISSAPIRTIVSNK